MKQSEILKLSNEELSERLGESKKSYRELKMTHAVSPLVGLSKKQGKSGGRNAGNKSRRRK